jgi:hypothetical protein
MLRISDLIAAKDFEFGKSQITKHKQDLPSNNKEHQEINVVPQGQSDQVYVHGENGKNLFTFEKITRRYGYLETLDLTSNK